MPTFTRSQVTFLQALQDFDLHLYDFSATPNCGSMALETVHDLVVCVSDEASGSSSGSSGGDTSGSANAGGSDSDSGGSSGVMVGIIVGIIIALAVVAGVYWWIIRKRNRANKNQSTYHTDEAQTGSNNYLWNDDQLRALRVDAQDIEDLRKIGSGSFGVVWLVRYRSTQLLASKRLLEKPGSTARTQQFVEEIKLVAQFDHPNIVKFMGAAWSFHNDIQALFEYMENGDLRDYLADRDQPADRVWTAEKLHIAGDIVEALVYVHSFVPSIVHRDLKSRNVLLSNDFRAKLTDFGTARAQSENNTMTVGVGTGRWLAPEVLSGSKDYGPPADVFSFGVMLSELDTHEIPYDDARGPSGKKLTNVAILQMVAIGQVRPTFSPDCPPDLRALAEHCMAQEPETRPTTPQVAYELRKLQKSLGLASYDLV